MWNLINNNLKVFIDPFIFMGLKNLDQRIDYEQKRADEDIEFRKREIDD
jgi:hypothetical protein